MDRDSVFLLIINITKSRCKRIRVDGLMESTSSSLFDSFSLFSKHDFMMLNSFFKKENFIDNKYMKNKILAHRFTVCVEFAKSVNSFKRFKYPI